MSKPSRFGYLALVTWLALAATTSAEPHKYKATSLCAALEAIQPGDRLPVVVQGIYSASGDLRVFYDLHPQCRRKVEPLTWVDFELSEAIPDDLRQHIARDQSAWVSFSGVLWGPQRPPPDDLALPADLAATRRSGQGYGHLNSYRTRLVVESVYQAWFPLAEMWYKPPSGWQADRSPFPKVNRFEPIARYPVEAAAIGVFGDVVVEVVVAKGELISTTVISARDRLLIEDTLANIKTWEFEPNSEATFTTTYSYRFEDLPSTTASVRVHSDLPVRVEIIGARGNWSASE